MDMDKSLENVNIAEICRACFEACEQYKKLTDDVDNFSNRKLGDIFSDVVQIELKSSADISPSRLCLPCSKDLLSANQFIQKCQQNNERFLEFLRNTNIKQPDCLSEFPIDIPTGSHSSDLLQIKIETEELTEFTADTLTDEKASAHSSSDSEASDYELPHQEVQKINKMQCVYCDRVFKRADFLQNHRRKHEEEFKKKGESMGNCSISVGDESETVCNTTTEQNTRELTNRSNSDSSAYQSNSNENCDKEFFRLQESCKPMTTQQSHIKGNSNASDILQLKYEISNLKETCLKEFSEIKALILNQNLKKLEVNVKETSNLKKRIKEIENDNTRIITPLEFDKLFPMNSDDDLRTLNSIGEKYKLFAIQTVRQLVHHGGLCTNMNKVFGNKIVVNYNYEGKSGKKSLKDFVQVNEILFHLLNLWSFKLNLELCLKKRQSDQSKDFVETAQRTKKKLSRICEKKCSAGRSTVAMHCFILLKEATKKRKSQIQQSKITTRSQGKKTKPISGRFQCDSCSKSFAWKKDLYRHERCHKPNTKKFSCPHCERRFLRKDKLNSHLLVHLAGITKSNPLFSFQYFAQCLFSEKKFKHLKCMICNYDSASNVHNLRSHIVSHKNLELVEDLGNSSVVKRFYPDKGLKEVILLIKDQIEENKLGKLYSIINENTFEMGISDSDESDPDLNHQYNCEVCNESFNRKHKLMTHQANEHSFQECPYKCGKCKLKFTCQEIFKSHLKHHCENPDKEYICRKCPGRFTWPTNFENHECRKRNMKATELKKKSTACEVCEKVFTCLRDLRIHKKTHIPGDKSRNCLICGETFFRPQDLRCHLKTHSKSEKILQEKTIVCMLCQTNFETIKELKEHLYIHSDGETDVNFENCEFVTSFYPDAEKSVITNHIRICFRENRLWQFYMVVNKFGLELTLSDSDSEVEKQTTEETSETYICELCDMKFPRMQAILQHQYDHGPTVNNFPNKCDNCKEQFVCEALLRRHVRSECLNPYRKHACSKCGIQFTWKINLDAHLCVIHEKSSEDNKTCEICGKKFIWLKDLHRHKRTHVPDGKKFECIVCEKKFNRKDNLRAHMKIHAIDYKQKPNTTIKWEQQDENMCRPHGEKIIQCKICFSKHNTIRDLRAHLLTHKNPNTLGQKESNIMALSMLLYNKQMDLRTLSQTISKDLTCGTNDHFYSITNEMGYELNLIDSETCTDMESNDDDDDDRNRNGVDVSKGYICKLCNRTFDRKFKIFEHQKNEHLWMELPFECVHCSAKFVCESLYRHHIQYNCENAEKQFKCKRCPLKFMWKDNLKIHEKYLHDKNPILPKKHHCNSCDKSFLWYKDLLRHKKNHQNNERKFECTWCFRIFMRSDNLKVHMKVHQNANHLLLPDIYYLARPNGTKIAQCKHCDQKYSTIYELLEHIQMIHLTYQLPGTIPNPTSYSITNALGYEMDIEDSETEREETTEKYICEVCGAQFNRRFKLLQHQQSLHYSDNIPHKCNQCSFKCVSEAVLGYHMRTQCKNALKQFCCSKCTMRFMWEENLENHENLIHDSRRTHTCGVCKQDFATHHDLKSHNDCKPPIEIKIFECNLCNRKYNRKDRLMKHKKVHSTGPKEAQVKSTQSTDKKFLCAFCGKEVSSSSNLVIHMRRHTGEKPFKCEFCNKGFPRSSDLSCHRRTHTGEKPHKCLDCGKAFSRSYKLQTHKRVHSGERPYKCSYCEKSFTQSNDLTLHVRRHTGERPYICEICGERFIQGTALRNHRRMRGHYEI